MLLVLLVLGVYTTEDGSQKDNLTNKHHVTSSTVFEIYPLIGLAAILRDHEWSHKSILIYSDIFAVVHIINKGLSNALSIMLFICRLAWHSGNTFSAQLMFSVISMPLLTLKHITTTSVQISKISDPPNLSSSNCGLWGSVVPECYGGFPN